METAGLRKRFTAEIFLTKEKSVSTEMANAPDPSDLWIQRVPARIGGRFKCETLTTLLKRAADSLE